jgi:TolA-binding protein
MRPSSHRASLLAVLFIGCGGCITLKADHDELAAEVTKLRTEVAQAKETTEASKARADELTHELEEVLRRNQADLGLKVDNLEYDVQELRGQAENADFAASAVKQELNELRADFDGRLLSLEEKLNEVTNIPESKTELFAEAERLLQTRKYKESRRLWRIYESRYPNDERNPEVRFNIGLTHFSERDYKSALGEFYRVIQDSPSASVIPDALYYSGLAFAKLGQCDNAIAYFEALREKKTKAPDHYKKKAAEQIQILRKDDGDICLDKAKRKS